MTGSLDALEPLSGWLWDVQKSKKHPSYVAQVATRVTTVAVSVLTHRSDIVNTLHLLPKAAPCCEWGYSFTPLGNRCTKIPLQYHKFNWDMINWGTSSGCIFNSASLETSGPTAPRLPASAQHSLCQPTGECYVLWRLTVSWHCQAQIASESLLKALSWCRGRGLSDMCDSWGGHVAKWTETGRMAWPTSTRATPLSLHKSHRYCSALFVGNIQQAKA